MKRKQTITPIIAGIAALASLIVTANGALALSRAEIKQIVISEATNSPVPPSLALAVAKIESDFNARALSAAGARGVMQIMPATARSVFGVGKDELWNARLNIQLGIDYLAKLYRQYGRRWDLALSHYNGGTLSGQGGNAVAHAYTRKYVRRVLNWRQRYREQSRVWMVAANQKTDGWQAARTRPYQVATARTRANNVRMWRRSVSSQPNLRKRSPRALARVKLERWFKNANTKVINDDSWSTILERRLRNRHRLDDFTPRFKWKVG
jgi:hypothetical protein